jgi:ankyrin repeat protein
MILKIAPAVDTLGNNALHYACWGGNFLIVKSLIEENIIDPSIKNAEGLTAIQFAIAGKHIEIVQYLSKLSSGRLAAETTDSGLTGLHRAAIYGSLETIKLLLSANSETADAVSVDSRAYNGNTVLHLSAQHGGMDIVKYFIEECKAEINAQNDYDLTPLHFACLG